MTDNNSQLIYNDPLKGQTPPCTQSEHSWHEWEDTNKCGQPEEKRCCLYCGVYQYRGLIIEHNWTKWNNFDVTGTFMRTQKHQSRDCIWCKKKETERLFNVK